MDNDLLIHEDETLSTSDVEKRFNTSGQATTALVSDLQKRSTDADDSSDEDNG